MFKRLILVMCLLLPLLTSGQKTQDGFVEMSSDTIKDPKALQQEIEGMFGKESADSKKQQRTSRSDLELSELDSHLSALVDVYSSGYSIQDKKGDKWRSRDSEIVSKVVINVDNFYLSTSGLIKPWVYDSLYKKEKDESPILESVTDSKGKEYEFQALGKELVVSKSNTESHIQLAVLKSEVHKNLIVISSGDIDDKSYRDVENYKSISDVSGVKLESSYDKYHGSFVLGQRFNQGRIEFDVVAIITPSVPRKDGKPVIHKISKGNVSDFINLRKSVDIFKEKKNKNKKSSKKKRKKFLGIF